MSLLKKLASQTAIYGLSSIIGRLLNYLLVPLYTRIFLPEEYGVVTELYGYVGFLMVIFTYGMETAFFRYIKEEKHSEKTYSTALISLLTTSTVFVSFFLLFAQPIADFIRYPEHSEYITCFALVLGFDALSSIPFAQLRYKEKPIQFATIKLINIGINIGLNIFFLVLCPKIAADYAFIDAIYNPAIGVGYIFISNLIASAVTLLLLLPNILGIKWQFDRDLWGQMIRYALPLTIVGFAGIINEMLDRVLLKYLLPYDESTNMAQLGIYGACYKLSILMTLFIQAFRYAAEPFFFAQSNKENATQVYADVLKYFSIIGLGVFLLVSLFLNIFKHFIGESFHAGLYVVPILLLANLCLGIYYNLSIWYKLTNNTMKGAVMAIGGALITIVLNLLLIPQIGYYGSAWATLICYASMVACSYLWGKKHYPIPYNLKLILSYILYAIALFFIDQYLHQQFNLGQGVLTYLQKILFLVIFILPFVLIEGKNWKSRAR